VVDNITYKLYYWNMKKRGITAEEFKQKLFKTKPGFKEVYEKSQPQFELTCAMIDARLKNNLTQEQLAKKIGSKQAVISRVESGANVSVDFLQRVANALDLDLQVKLIPRV